MPSHYHYFTILRNSEIEQNHSIHRYLVYYLIDNGLYIASCSTPSLKWGKCSLIFLMCSIHQQLSSGRFYLDFKVISSWSILVVLRFLQLSELTPPIYTCSTPSTLPSPPPPPPPPTSWPSKLNKNPWRLLDHYWFCRRNALLTESGPWKARCVWSPDAIVYQGHPTSIFGKYLFGRWFEI